MTKNLKVEESTRFGVLLGRVDQVIAPTCEVIELVLAQIFAIAHQFQGALGSSDLKCKTVSGLYTHFGL